ncbi:hypothetical protein ILYODFUR_035978, partial [Ilyodon furcidens]
MVLQGNPLCIGAKVMTCHRPVRQKINLDEESLKELGADYGLCKSTSALFQEALSDSDRIRILQQQNEDLRHRLSLSTHKMEAMEAEFEGSRHYMEAELSRTRDDLDKMRDKFR